MRVAVLRNSVLVLALAVASSSAAAVPIKDKWKLRGVCSFSCADVGLEVDDRVRGKLTVEDDPDYVIGEDAVGKYLFLVGDLGPLHQNNSRLLDFTSFETTLQALSGFVTIRASSGELVTIGFINGGPWTFSLSAGSAQILTVPEPDTLLLFGVGLLVLGWAARWRTSETTRKHER